MGKLTSVNFTNYPNKNKLFPPNFIDIIDMDPRLKYADTDSSYSTKKLPFPKLEDPHKTVDYCQKIARANNDKYLNVFRTLLKDRANINPKYNRMNFKSEVVAARGFFNSKKFYALGKIWDEGTFFPELNEDAMKKTGGQILKADCSDITFNMLTEIYKVLVLDTSIKDEKILYKIIFHDIKNKYIELLSKAINRLDFNSFIVPKKWPLGERKTIPIHVKGAMLYNTLFQDNIRPGESISLVQIRINPEVLYKYISKLYQKNTPSRYQIPLSEVNHKLNVITFPSFLNTADPIELAKIQQLFKDLQIEPNFDKIIDFNIIKKINQFEKLFENRGRGGLGK